VLLADPVSETWYDRDWRSLPEIDLLGRGRLTPGARVFNLGAHQCVLAAVLAKTVGANGQVVAVEANAHNCAIAERNKRLNALNQLEIVHAAVADIPGSVYCEQSLNSAVTAGSSEWPLEEVPAVTVDELSERFGIPDVLYVDVEGYEVRVLRGAQRTLASAPDCFIEVHVRPGLERYGDSVADLLGFFSRPLYTLYVAAEHGEELHSIELGTSPLDNRFLLVALSQIRDAVGDQRT
jgi:FkbM family methyltransferase